MPARITVDPEYQVEPGDVVLTKQHVVLDFFLAVGSRMGLDVLLPGDSSPAFLCPFTLNIAQPFKQFPLKHGLINFNPEGCMHFLGRAMGNDIFVAFVRPDDLESNNTYERGKSQKRVSTILTTIRTRIFRQFIANVVAKCKLGLDTRGEYAIPLEDDTYVSTGLGDLGYEFL